MSWLSRLVTTFRSRRLDDELDEELRFHLEARAEQLVEEGLTFDEASREARRRLGLPLGLRESSRDVKLIPWLDSIGRDVLFGLRVLRKDALVTWAAIVSLSLAIGACTAAFSLIEALILRPLPVADPERLVYLTYPVLHSDGSTDEQASFSYPLFERLREAGRPYVDLFGMNFQEWRRRAVFEDSGAQEEKVHAQWISGNAFALLGVKPAWGRLLTAADDQRPGDHPVAVLSHAFWTRRFGGSPSVVGRWLTLDEKQYQIVGVAEEGLAGVEPGLMTDLWVPNMMWNREALAQPGWQWFRILGRLKPGVAPGQARQVLQATFAEFRRERAQTSLRADEPRDRVERFLKTPLIVRSAANGPSSLRRTFERPLWILAAVVGLLLLIACSNVANLLVARAARREKEMALRISIGAGRARVVQQMLIESGLLASAACLIGVAFALFAAPVIAGSLSPADNPAYLDLHLNGTVLGFLAGLCALTTVLFGTVPALRASAVSPNETLKADGGRHTAGPGLLRPLVAAQVGFSFVVLFVAGLLLVSFQKLARLDPGFTKEGLVLFGIEAKEFRPGGANARAVWQQLQDTVSHLPEVRAASLSAWGLFAGSGWSTGIRVPGREVDASEPYFLEVSSGFFATMGLRLIDGRGFQPSDAETEAPRAVVVNETFARRYFPGETPLGRHFSRVDRNKLVDQEIVGLARDAKYNSLRETTAPTVYVPLQAKGNATLEVRTATDPVALAARLRPEIARVHAAFRLTDVTTQSALIDGTLVRERLLALLSGFFATVALVLAAVGLYGVLSYAVARRTREIGIRLALGARPAALVRLVVGDVALLVVLGLVAGIASGLPLARFLASLLFEVRPSGFWSLALPLGWLLFAATLAALPAALRAVRVDPTVALRYE